MLFNGDNFCRIQSLFQFTKTHSWQFLGLDLNLLQIHHSASDFFFLIVIIKFDIFGWFVAGSCLRRLASTSDLLKLLEFLHRFQDLNNLKECRPGGVHHFHNLCILVIPLQPHLASKQLSARTSRIPSSNTFRNADFAFTR